MTVKELIETLKTCDENANVVIEQGEDVYVECGECGESFYINDDNYVLNS